MVAADDTAPGGGVAAPGIKQVPRDMRPSVLHIRRQLDVAAPGQCAGRDVHLVMRQFGPDRRIKRDTAHGLGHRVLRAAAAAIIARRRKFFAADQRGGRFRV
jgi:hypothetical protein